MKTVLTYRSVLDTRKVSTSSGWVWKVRSKLKKLLTTQDNILFVEWILTKPRKQSFEEYLSGEEKRDQLVKVIEELDYMYKACLRQRKQRIQGKHTEFEIEHNIDNLKEWIEIYNDWDDDDNDEDFE